VRAGGDRAILALAGALVVAALLSALLPAARPGRSGPRSSSYATQPAGVAALHDLLERRGHPVGRLRRAPAEAGLTPSSTLFVLDPEGLTGADAEALAAFVRAGGRLVAGGGAAVAVAGALLPNAPTWAPGGAREARPAGGAPETRGVRAVRTAGDGRFAQRGGGRAILIDAAGAPVALAADVGRGRLLLLADPSVLQNRLLGSSDAGAFAVGLAGPPARAVVFAESVHGYGEAAGLGALPGEWVLALAGLALAGLAFLWSHGRRLGPPEAVGRALPPPRRDYADAMAVTLGRTHDPAAAAAPVRRAARDGLAERAGLERGAAPAAVAAAARRLGLEEDEALAVAGERDDDVMAAGRALARLRRGVR